MLDECERTPLVVHYSVGFYPYYRVLFKSVKKCIFSLSYRHSLASPRDIND